MVVQNHPACTVHDQGEVLIDTFSITLDLSCLSDYCVVPAAQFLANGLESDSNPNDHFAVWQALAGLLFSMFGGALRLSDSFTRGRNFFNHSIALDDSCGFVAFGGNNSGVDASGSATVRPERLQIYLTGDGCQRVSLVLGRHWSELADWLDSHGFYNPRITRVDVAYDDHDGHRSVDGARDMYASGAFTNRGRPPKAQYIDDMGSGDGRTFYVGDRANGKTLRVYEKGRQLGDKESQWCRWEVELKSVDRDIPFDVLRRPGAYLSGSYPALRFISSAQLVIRTGKVKEAIQFSHMLKHARSSYGAFINYMAVARSMTADQIIAELSQPKCPARLVWTTFDHEEAQRPPLPDHKDRYPHLYQSA